MDEHILDSLLRGQERQVYTVSQINGYVKCILEEDPVVSRVRVRGEISNLKLHSSGHLYFSLKDSGGTINAAMFKWQRQYLRFAPANGMNVIADGRVTLYEPSGQYQLVASAMCIDGVGELFAAYERLKAKLEAEGLFDSSRKRPLPFLPKRVGVITSRTGAALQDILNILGRRCPLAQVVVCPSAVQGADAPEQLCAAIKKMNDADACDVLIVGRGGGSIEDLWAFNDESVARAVAASRIPVISAVGHETDFVITDLAADLRAPTPSAAAELAVPDIQELTAALADYRLRMRAAVSGKLDDCGNALAMCRMRGCFSTAMYPIEQRAQYIDSLTLKMSAAMERAVADKRERLARCAARLAALNPLDILARGYCAASREDTIISKAQELNPGDKIKLRFNDGCAMCTVD